MPPTLTRTPRPLSPEAARHGVAAAIGSVAPTADLDTVEQDDPLWPALGLDEQDRQRFVEVLVGHTGVRIEAADLPRLRTLASATAFLVVASRTRPPR